VRACNRHNTVGGREWDEVPTLFLEFHGSSEREVADQLLSVKDICQSVLEDHIHTASMSFISALGHEATTQLWSARHRAYYSTLAMRTGSRGFITDVCVPISNLRAVLESARRVLDEAQLYGTIVGHVGEGNFHCILPVFESDTEEMDRVWAAAERIVQCALDAGGTCTGEHGVGMGKRGYLAREFGAGTLSVMQTVKQSLDPQGIMNPGKALPALISNAVNGV